MSNDQLHTVFCRSQKSMKGVALLLTLLSVAVLQSSCDESFVYSENNTKLITAFFNRRNGDHLPWTQKSSVAKARARLAAAKCPAGWTCDSCNITEVPCLNVSLYCDHFTACVARRTAACEAPHCDCTPGWTTDLSAGGKQCSVDVDECAEKNPCTNGGRCVNLKGGYTCECATGWAGKDCAFPASCSLPTATCGANAVCKEFKYDGKAYADCRCKQTFVGDAWHGCTLRESHASSSFAFARTKANAVSGRSDCYYRSDPHLKTFDELYVDYHGECPTTFSEYKDDSEDMWYKIVTDLYKSSPGAGYTLIDKVWFYVSGLELYFQRDWTNPLSVRINKEKIALKETLYWPDQDAKRRKVIIEPHGNTITIKTPWELELQAQLTGGSIELTLSVPQTFEWKGQTVGLCGNNNQDRCDDLILPDSRPIPYCPPGQPTQAEANHFGDEWAKINIVNYPEESGCKLSDGTPNIVTEEDLEWAEKMGMCNKLIDPAGPFQECLSIVTPAIAQDLLRLCKRDVGTFRSKPSESDEPFVCANYLQPYAEACRNAQIAKFGKTTLNWRSKVNCPPPTCGANAFFHEQAPAPSCINSCDDHLAQARSDCHSLDIQEACVCNQTDWASDVWYVRVGDKCVKYPFECPGRRAGKIMMSEEDTVSFMCNEHCLLVTENGVNKFQCKNFTCVEHSKCGVRDNVLDCYCEPGYIGDGRFGCEIPRQNCADLKHYFGVTESGVQSVWGLDGKPMQVFCDMTTDDGGWTLIQRREDGLTNFNVGWQEYQAGFGAVASKGSFWQGLDNIVLLTNNSRSEMQLRIDFTACDGKQAFEIYDKFKVESEESNYKLHLFGASGTAGDALTMQEPKPTYNANEMYFSTLDSDHDALPGSSCSSAYGKGGWWFNKCTKANLNGVYYPDCGGAGKFDAITWLTTKYRKIEMKVRPKVYPPTD